MLANWSPNRHVNWFPFVAKEQTLCEVSRLFQQMERGIRDVRRSIGEVLYLSAMKERFATICWTSEKPSAQGPAFRRCVFRSFGLAATMRRMDNQCLQDSLNVSINR